MKISSILTTFLLFLLISTSSGGTFDKGTKSFGGGAAFIHQSGSFYNEYSALTINMKYTSAFAQSSFFGTVIEVDHINQIDYTSTDFAAGIILEKYAFSRQDDSKMFPFFKAQVTIGSISKTLAISFGVNFGMTFMLSDAMALEVGGAYTLDRFSKNGQSVTGDYTQATAGISTFIF